MNTNRAEMADLNSKSTVWAKTANILKREIGEDAFGSWLAPASLADGPLGDVFLVTHTGVARDWVRRYAWRRISELWVANDPEGREIRLKARQELVATVETPREEPAPAGRAAPTEDDCRRVGFLQDRFTFDTFVVGASNEFANAVARRVASWADGHFNPVLFHGPYGFGKTHLLNALAWEALKTDPGKKVVYLTAERFVSGFIQALMERRVGAFKEELRSADLLLIDDVQFIGGKQSTQEELFHTLAALMEGGRRVVFSADRPPSALTELDARLRSHLSAGLACGIEPADRALRLGIIDCKTRFLGARQGFTCGLRPEVSAFLVDRFGESVRELEGALNVLIARLGGGVGALTLDEAQTLLRPHLRAGDKRITVDEIQKATSEHFGLKQSDLISPGRARALARPRQAAMWLCKQLTTRSLPDIGRRFGGRDHTTVLHAVRRIDELRAADPRLARDLEQLTHKLRG